MPPKFKVMWMIMIEQGATAGAALNAPDGMIDSMTNCGNFLLANWCPEGEMAVTSLPMSRDARRGGTKQRYFELKRLYLSEHIKISRRFISVILCAQS